jgi:hypothetical protein
MRQNHGVNRVGVEEHCRVTGGGQMGTEVDASDLKREEQAQKRERPSFVPANLEAG